MKAATTQLPTAYFNIVAGMADARVIHFDPLDNGQRVALVTEPDRK